MSLVHAHPPTRMDTRKVIILITTRSSRGSSILLVLIPRFPVLLLVRLLHSAVPLIIELGVLSADFGLAMIGFTTSTGTTHTNISTPMHNT